jgi:hypothetical protein
LCTWKPLGNNAIDDKTTNEPRVRDRHFSGAHPKWNECELRNILPVPCGGSGAVFIQQITKQVVFVTSGAVHRMRFCRSFLWLFLASLTLVPSLLAGQAPVPAEIENPITQP